MSWSFKLPVKVAGLLGLLLVLALASCKGGGEEEASPSPTGTPGPAASPSIPRTPAAAGTPTTPGPGDTPATDAQGFTILVDTTADADSRDGFMSLREAILLATGELAVADLDSGEADNVEGSPGAESADTIGFYNATFPPDAPATIVLTAALPTLGTGNDTIDGRQAGVIIDGGGGGFKCLHIDSSGNAIKGLEIQNCHTAILLKATATNNTIGGPTEAERNVISGNAAVGIQINGSANRVVGNYIGTDASGTASKPNMMEGIWIAPGAKDNVIGGSKPEERNVISGNNLFGVSIDGQESTGNVVKGNYIGVDVSGRTALKNRYGLTLTNGARDNVVGGSEPEDANVISGNQSGGVLIRGAGTSNNMVIGNYIGTDASESEKLGNGTGIWILEGPQNNSIGTTRPGEGNVIAWNLIFGVLVESSESTGNQIRGNSMYDNAREGIVNRKGGALELASPTITGANPVAGTACPNCTVDIYSDSADEGETYEGSTQADANGRFTFNKTLSGPFVTAIAIDGEGNTSGFSNAFPVPSR